MPKKKFTGSLCVYCGIQPATTVDHVIPECLFIKPLPAHMIKVPACTQCNNAKSRNDDYLRDMLVVDVRCAGHPIVQTLLTGQVTRSVRKNRSLIGRAAAVGRMEPMHTMGGIYLGHYHMASLDNKRIEEIFTTIVRGLYYAKFQRRLPDNYQFEVGQIDTFRARETWQQAVASGGNGPFRLGEGVFTCWLAFADSDPAITEWLLLFYDCLLFVVSTEPPDNQEVESL